jgi:hypothetical protein
LPRGGRCVAGRVARAYLRDAETPKDEALRARRLLALAGQFVFGMTIRGIARGLSLDSSLISRDILEASDGMRRHAEDLGLSDSLFARNVTFEGGEGI